ncbi:MAG: hypothetical protein DRP08_07345, partial [Candidatus Aenigmatarchaeota archaeon]
MVITAKLRKTTTKKINAQLQARLDAAGPKILKRTAELVEERMKANPSIFVIAAQSILNEMQGFYYAGGAAEAAEDKADFSNEQYLKVEVETNISETLKVAAGENGITWSAVIVSDEFMGFSQSIGKSDPGKPGTLPWIAFFIAGSVIGQGNDLLWINQEVSTALSKVAAGWKEDAPREYG